VLETVEALRKQGHECVEFVPPDVAQALSLFAALTSADGYKTLLSHLGPDPKENSLFLVTLGPKLPGLVRWLAAWVVETFLHDKQFAACLRASHTRSVFQNMQVVAQRDEYIKDFNDQVWNKYKFDGIIAPVQALPQLRHGGCDNLTPLAAATIVWNIVDCPAGCIPITKVDPSKDQLTDEWVNGPGLGSPILEKEIYRSKSHWYDPVGMKGMPVGIQVVGKRWEDEKVVAMMHVIDKALGERGFGPGSLSGA